LYLIINSSRWFAQLFVGSRLVVSVDATASANNILASESLWRIAFAGELIMLVCAVAPALILYVLLRPVNRNIALLAVFFNLVSIAIEGIDRASLDPKFGWLVASQRLNVNAKLIQREK